MRITIFPHLSGAYSMQRYFNGVYNALQQVEGVEVVLPISLNINPTFFEKYISYTLKAFSHRVGLNLILSERFSFLLLVLRPSKSIVICHDMITLMRKEVSIAQWLWYKFLLLIMNRASKIICVSHTTRNDLLRLNKFIPHRKVEVIYNGLEEFWFKNPLDSGIEKSVPYFLVVGTDLPTKNFEWIIAAIEILKKKQPDFKVIKIGEIKMANRKKITDLELDRWIVNLQKVSDEKLKALYHGAEALLIPSKMEGFGWPSIEAMACGCPVIIGPAKALHEVCEDAAYQIDSPDNLAAAMQKFYRNAPLRVHYETLGRIQAQKYTWGNFVKKLFESISD